MSKHLQYKLLRSTYVCTPESQPGRLVSSPGNVGAMVLGSNNLEGWSKPVVSGDLDELE